MIVNPSPDRGLEGCRPLVDYWASLSRSEYDVPAERASAHELAFLGPNPAAPNPPPGPEVTALANAGFQPFMSPEHLGHAGSVQLLYLGDFGAWHFFEHALVSANEGLVLRRPLTASQRVVRGLVVVAQRTWRFAQSTKIAIERGKRLTLRCTLGLVKLIVENGLICWLSLLGGSWADGGSARCAVSASLAR